MASSGDFWIYIFSIPAGEKREILLSQLSLLPFNGFLENDHDLQAYLPLEEERPDIKQQIAELAQKSNCTYERIFLPSQNWNKKWEEAFQPVRVGDFVGIRAEFHPSFEGVTHELLIHPRMAFGTGHHATTYLVMERMQEMDWTGKSVFDFGCGTGILAILAKKLGAGETVALDIEEAATENTLVNMSVNDIDQIEVYTGELKVIPPAQFEIILANINRNVILNTLGALYQRCASGGHLLISGILKQDEEKVESVAIKEGWKRLICREREGWLMIHYQKA
jgi:ribosomal protein L11 methyltransferase